MEALRGVVSGTFEEFWVEGEIGSLHLSRPGHIYFELKDGKARLSAVLFQSAARFLEFEPTEGMQVRARASLDVYPPQGRLQLLVDELQPAGAGTQRQALELLRRQLYAEGLFAPERKKPLPFWPRGVGIVTSVRGAALHDFLRALQRRAAPGVVLVYDARVQGDAAWREVVRGLHVLDADPRVEVIVLARGGGSSEDLWTFNREEVVRAIAELETPLVSAIGHEVDVVLADLVADARAATPTAAAALVLPDREPLQRRVEIAQRRLAAAQQRRLRELRQGLAVLQRGLVHPARRMQNLAERLAALAARLRAGLERSTLRRAGRLEAVVARLEALSPLRVLGRGYSIVFDERDGRVVRSSRELAPGDSLRLRLGEGSARAQVLSAEMSAEASADASAGDPVDGAE